MSGVRKVLLFCSCFMILCGISADAAPKLAKKPATSAPAAAGPGPATEKEKLTYSGPPVMDPSMAAGMAAMGYASAKAAPEVMSKLFCYCGCDQTDSHSALIDCFTGTHGMDCHICQEEAVLALKMYRDGATMAEIQKRVDSTYSNQYPFETKTDALKKYEATHLGVGTATTTPDVTITEIPKGKDGKPKLKPGMTAGACCSEGNHKKK
jgi:hypothetical protein